MSGNEIIFSGDKGYVTLEKTVYKGTAGAALKIENPNNPVNTVPFESLEEINKALDVVEEDANFKFLILYGSEGRIHAGADVVMFSGGVKENEDPPDYENILNYLNLGTSIDVRVKNIGRSIKTVSIMNGERFGGSVEWPLMTEYCIATPETGIQFSEVNIGIIPGWDGIMNIVLKSGPANALFMGTTGIRIDAQNMLDAGIITQISEPEKAMENALEMAAGITADTAQTGKKHFASEEELYRILAERLDTKRYEKLADDLKGVQSDFEPKEFSKHIDRKLMESGKPVAPLAVESVFGLIAKYSAFISNEDIGMIREMGFDEAKRCSDLMKTNDRKIGIDSILKARENPFNKIPIYTRT